jgi:hypothetical protein
MPIVVDYRFRAQLFSPEDKPGGAKGAQAGDGADYTVGRDVDLRECWGTRLAD